MAFTVVPFYFFMENVTRISATSQAISLIRILRDEHGELMFHQSGNLKLVKAMFIWVILKDAVFLWAATNLNIGNIHTLRWM